MYGIRQCNRIFLSGEIGAFFTEIFFSNFSCDIEFQIYTTKYSNLLLIILILVWIVCSTYRKGEILMQSQKWHVTSQFVYCYTHLHSKCMVNTICIDHNTALSVYRVCYFLVPHTHVLCMGSGSATGFFYAVRLVHSLLKYFFKLKFQLWYWIQIYTTKYSNLLLIILILVWIVCSTYRKGEILMQKWHVTSQFVYCYMPY